LNAETELKKIHTDFRTPNPGFRASAHREVALPASMDVNIMEAGVNVNENSLMMETES